MVDVAAFIVTALYLYCTPKDPLTEATGAGLNAEAWRTDNFDFWATPKLPTKADELDVCGCWAPIDDVSFEINVFKFKIIVWPIMQA